MPTTPTFALPYPAATDPFNVPTDLQALATALEAYLVPVGTILHTLRSSAPSGWLFHNQTVTSADTLYPALWAVAPASWKSGTSLVIPNLADSVLIQQSTTSLGGTGGANSRTIANSQLPPHVHAITHDHASVTTSDPGNHQHNDNSATGDWIMTDIGASSGSLDLHDGGSALGYGVTSVTAAAGAHTHTVDLPSFVGASGDGGFPNAALDTTPKHLAVNLMIKAA
jgi:microcystin-dependent protein